MSLPEARIMQGDVLAELAKLPDESVNCCVTSPPYWGLRDYGVPGQLGLEPTPDEYIAKMVAVFREVRRVLRGDGVCFVNLGDNYASIGHKKSHSGFGTTGLAGGIAQEHSPCHRENNGNGLKHKDLVGMPWRVVLALQADGWWLRQDIIWHRPNPMPESVTDRCSKAHEYIFLLTKSARYWWDQKAIMEPSIDPESLRPEGRNPRNDDKFAKQFLDDDRNGPARTRAGFANLAGVSYPMRNRRSVWTIPSEPFDGAHFAVFPTEIPKLCILAGCPVGGTVLDPFAGSGTTGAVALELARNAILIELNPKYVDLIRQRLDKVTPGLPLTA